MWFLVVGMEKGIIDREKGGLEMWLLVGMEKGIIDCEKGGPERGGLLL